MMAKADGVHIPSVPVHATAAEADLKAFNLQSDRVLSIEAIMLVMGLFSVSQSL